MHIFRGKGAPPPDPPKKTYTDFEEEKIFFLLLIWILFELINLLCFSGPWHVRHIYSYQFDQFYVNLHILH